MKKISTILFLSLTAAGFAQTTTWPVSNSISLDPTRSAIIGIHNKRSLNFITGDSTRVVIDSLGRLKMPKLAFEPSVSGEVRFAYFDKDGNISNKQIPGVSISCGTGTSPWILGGNTISNTSLGNVNVIGPCNMGFILQGNAKKSLALNNGNLGIGENNFSPSAIADISDPSTASGQREHLRIYGDAAGKIESTNNMNLYYNTDFDINHGSPASSTSMFHIDNSTGNITIANELDINGSNYILGDNSVNGNCAIGGNTHINGNTTIGTNAYVSGKIGIGNTSPSVKLDITDASAAKVHVSTGNSNPAEIWATNSTSSYAFRIDGTGVGRISNDVNNSSPINLLSFSNTPTAGPQVWIGNLKPTATAYTDFNFAVAGKLVAKSVYVTLNCTWADYVFDNNYKLPKLSDVESYYKANKHLPEVPSAKEVEEKGIDVGDMNALLLKKVEELTLYMVEQQKITNALKKEIADLKEQSK